MIYNLPRAKKKGETWVINETPIITSGYYFDGNCSITREGVTYPFTRLEITNTVKSGQSIFYVGIQDKLVDSGTSTVYAVKSMYVSFTGWLDSAYRTVTFFEPPTGDLLTWLQSNAIKQ